MECLLIFDHLNDIIYTKYNTKFKEHINNFASTNGLILESAEDENIDNNVIVQIFSPIITSHRIMSCQFGNSYTSIQCQDGLNIYFDEYMGYLFVNVSNKAEQYMKKYTSVCITMVRYLCGPDVYQLKSKTSKSATLSELIDSWTSLNQIDQAILIEAVEQLVVNADLSTSTIQALHASVAKLSSKIECSKIHALVLVQNRFLSLYSSQNAKELSPTDILFCTILCHSTKKSSKSECHSYQLLLSGPEYQPKCLPHAVHIVNLSSGISIVYLLEIGNTAIASSLYETFTHLHTMQNVQIQRDKELMQPAFENLDLATRKLNDSLKKHKNSLIENCHKQLMKKWDVIRKKYLEFIKSKSDEALLRAETLALGFLENLKELLSLTAVDETVLKSSGKFILHCSKIVEEKLRIYDDFLMAKSIKNFSLGSRDSLTIKKYLEEFPGLVHFIYVDRTNHRVTMPTLENETEESIFTRNKIWSMVGFAQSHLQEGNFSLMWKDTTFNYAYFLWFEDNSGSPLKPVFPSTKLPLPGILCEDFYYKLKEKCFPKMGPSKIKCYELFCMHLGLVTASCVLEQTRRLSATIWELKGHPNHPIDLL